MIRLQTPLMRLVAAIDRKRERKRLTLLRLPHDWYDIADRCLFFVQALAGAA